jgi:urease accessory protein
VRKVVAREASKRAGGLSRGASGGAEPDEIADTLLLKFDDRRRQQGFVFGGKGTCIEFDFPEPPRLQTDDLLVLDDGRIVEVVADIEPLIELRARDLTQDFGAVARLLVALGNRHIPVQILASRIRLQKHPEAEALVAAHGLKGAELTAPFEPDEAAQPVHEHEHAHGDGHGHHHHHGDAQGRHDRADGHDHRHDGHDVHRHHGHHHHDK